MEPLTILLIDDDEYQLNYIDLLLEDIQEGSNTVFKTTSVDEGFSIIEKNPIDLVITDYVMPEINGFTVLKRIKEVNPEIDVVIITQFEDINTAVDVMRHGAYDYLIKPLSKEILESLILRVKEKQTLIKENRLLREQIQENFTVESIISKSEEMENVLNTTGKSAETDVNVLIRGESGTGKELIARAIHFASKRKNKSFITVNISALSPGLIESELFGHKKGAFTGAIRDHAGKFLLANGGTLFIDEVGDIPQAIQVKLLRALQFGQIEPVGGTESINVDVRIIAATSRNLEEMIKSEDFRLDFFYRLNVITIEIPPLRKRKTDIPLLIDHFIDHFTRVHHKKIQGISQEAMQILMKYDYPGNVRELENILQRAIVLCRGDILSQYDLPELNGSEKKDSLLDPEILNGDYEQKMRSFEKQIILEALKTSGGNKSAAARLLGIGERRFRYRMDVLGIESSEAG